jgi:hypothetical protein
MGKMKYGTITQCNIAKQLKWLICSNNKLDETWQQNINNLMDQIQSRFRYDLPTHLMKFACNREYKFYFKYPLNIKKLINIIFLVHTHSQKMKRKSQGRPSGSSGRETV